MKSNQLAGKQVVAKTMLITGATSGIGQALAYLAADKGYRVLACGRNESKLSELAQHDNIETLRFDVSSQEETHQALKSVECDIAVLNAGTCEYVDVEHFEADMFKRVFQANFFGVINCYEALSKQFKPGNQLVVVDSLARLLPFTRSQAYGASKAALYYFTKSLEVDLLPHGVIVQSVSPGFVETPLTDKNEFEMPMKISVDKAVSAFLKGIESKQRAIYFPKRFSFILRLLGALPSQLKKRIAFKLKQEAEKHD